MELTKICIKNYRSIEETTIEIKKMDDGSSTFGLIGVNEAGKSSILKALALYDNFETAEVSIKDFNNNKKNIEVEYHYLLDKIEEQDCFDTLAQRDSEYERKLETFENVILKVVINPQNPQISEQTLVIDGADYFGEKTSDYIEGLKPFFDLKRHKTIFWESEPRYLISEPINLANFSRNPSAISVPLENCFLLSGNEIIAEAIKSLSDSTERESLRETLGESVTSHIKRVWPNHPIKISFDISDGLIHFHVKDENSKSKAKTANQRSDGFKQFISFLLTLSAQSVKSELSNTIILLDEPETHLHPKAQEYLLQELIKITNNDKNNIVFFATHSNYMIDKERLNRNYKVTKPKEITILSEFDSKISTYASVNYDVFDIPSTDYHNELYGYLQEREDKFTEKDFEEFLKSKKLKSDIEYTRIKKDGSMEKYNVTLATKIRNIIHHPENKNNSFTIKELETSIDKLIAIKNEK